VAVVVCLALAMYYLRKLRMPPRGASPAPAQFE
jgi:hypothetical protein